MIFTPALRQLMARYEELSAAYRTYQRLTGQDDPALQAQVLSAWNAYYNEMIRQLDKEQEGGGRSG